MAASSECLIPVPATSRSANTGQDPFVILTPSLESSLASLTDSDIVAGVRLLRSIEPGVQYRPGDDHLSRKQLVALQCLSSMPSFQIETWLVQRHARNFEQNEDTPWQTNEVIASGSMNTFPPPTLPRLPNGPTVSQVQTGPIIYHSTADKQPRQFGTYDGFRRHEKERENFYVFLPDGVIEHLPFGPACVLCQHSEPNTEHFERHKVLRFMEDSSISIKKSRKSNFKILLQTHNVPDEHTDRLTKKWFRTETKQAYSCGLCIRLCSTLAERTSHLANEHYKKGESRDRWDMNTLIRGLLLQPDLNAEFRRRYSVNPSDPSSQLKWSPSDAFRLRDRLESKEEKLEVLVQAAFDLAVNSRSGPDSQNVATTSSEISEESRSPPDSTSPSVSHQGTITSPPFLTNHPGTQSTNVTNLQNQRRLPDHYAQGSQTISDQSAEPANNLHPYGMLGITAVTDMSQMSYPLQHEAAFDEQAVPATFPTSDFGTHTHSNEDNRTFAHHHLLGSNYAADSSADHTWIQGIWPQGHHQWPMSGQEGNPSPTTQMSPVAYQNDTSAASPQSVHRFSPASGLPQANYTFIHNQLD